MKSYKDNAKWLTWQAPFRVLSISSAFLAPFFLEKGLDLSQIFLLQSVFSLAYVLWELPSGYLADRVGRARSIQISAPIAAAAMVAYGFSGEFWQFVVCELLLAVANGLLSGVDTALLTDSLEAEKREHDFVRLRQRMDALGYAAVAFGVPVSFLLVQHVGIGATLVADGLLIAVGSIFGFRLVEAPRFNGNSSAEAVRLSAWHSIKQLSRNVEARWLVALGTSLAAATYFAYWLSAPYYTSLGIPVVWFGALLAARSLWKAWLAHRFHSHTNMTQKMTGYALTAGLVYAAMATQQVWLLWAVLGHDAVQALHRGPVTHQLNQHMAHEYRATLHSLVNLVQRLTYTVAGPVVGFMADRAGLPTTFAVTGAVCACVALLAVSRLRKLRTFEA
jgi:MFS family permease